MRAAKRGVDVVGLIMSVSFNALRKTSLPFLVADVRKLVEVRVGVHGWKCFGSPRSCSGRARRHVVVVESPDRRPRMRARLIPASKVAEPR